MEFIPTYVCPNCSKIMKIIGTECPFCNKTFTKSEIDDMYFVCPSCLSDKVELVLNDSNNVPNVGFTFTKAKYSAIIDLAQASVNSGMYPSFVCKNCATNFNSTNFYLTSSITEKSEVDQKISVKRKNRKINVAIAIILILLILLFVVLFN